MRRAIVLIVAFAAACTGAATSGSGSTGAAPPPPTAPAATDGGTSGAAPDAGSSDAGSTQTAPDAGSAQGTPDGGAAGTQAVNCAPRLYSAPGLPDVEGPVPCNGDTCDETAPAGLGQAFVAGERGALWVIGGQDFLREQDGKWVSTCPPWSDVVTAADGRHGDDVWVAGTNRMAHWDGASWTVTPSPLVGAIHSIFGDAREAFADVDTRSFPADHLLRWDGASWNDTGGLGVLLWADGAGRAWAWSNGKLLEWNGTSWPAVALPAGVAPWAAWAAAGGDLFVLGQGPNGPTVQRRHDGQFADLHLDAPPQSGGWIRGSSESDIWVGLAPTGVHAPESTRHWNGTSWQVVSDFVRPLPLALSGGEALYYSGRLQRLDGAPASPPLSTPPVSLQTASAAQGEVWMGGFAGLLRLAGHSWVKVADAPGTIISLAVAGPDDVWAEGGDGAVIHWNGTSVVQLPAPGTLSDGWSLRGVTTAGPGQLWSVGSQFVEPGGFEGNWTAWHWDGTWTRIATPAMTFVASIGSGPDGQLWVVDPDRVWQYDGSKWIDHGAPVAQPRVLSVGGSGDVWVSGNGLAHWDGTSWQSFGTLTIASFARAAPNDIWAVASPLPNGEHFDLWHWDGKAWTPQHEATLPLAFAALPNGELWEASGAGISHRLPR